MKDTLNKEDDYFIIPNPIYDVVFKYLMEDLESAKIILSTLINEKIISLNFEPISYTHKIAAPSVGKEITLFHLDFRATIELPNGEQEMIMIELQKARRPEDIFRFKRYIAKNFQQKHTIEVTDPKTKAVTTIHNTIRLIPIFILNFRIENEINDLLIKTSRVREGVFKKKQLQKENEFIDNLTYDIWVVQLPNLDSIQPKDYENDSYKTKLYFLFKLFDQKAQMENRHRLMLIRKIFPGYLERIISRLRSATSDQPELEEKMHIEDEYLSVLENEANEKSRLKQEVKEKEVLLQQQKEAMKQQKEAIEQQEKAMEQQKEAIEQQEKAIEQQGQIILNYAKMLKKSGQSLEDIHAQTQLPLDILEQL